MTNRQRFLVWTVGLGLAVVATPQARQATPAPQEHVAMLKANLAASKAALRQYEWIETTIVYYKDEEKSRKQNRCYYGAEGSIEKVLVSAPPEAKRARGLRGRIAENKKEELTDYMQQAVALVKDYAPPDPARLQAVKDAGGASLTPLPGPGKRIRLTFAGYKVPGDSLAVELDLASSTLLGATVASMLGSPDDAVKLTVSFATLNEGSSYTKDVVLEAPSQHVRVNVQNGGYRKLQ